MDTESDETSQPRRAGVFKWFGTIAATAAVVVAVGWEAQQITELNQRIDAQEHTLAAQRRALDLLSSGETVMVSLNPREEAEEVTGRLFLSEESQETVIVMDGLVQPTGDLIYTLWLEHDGRSQPVVDFDPDRNGLAVVSLGYVESRSTLAVTLEPQPGNATPRAHCWPLRASSAALASSGG